MDLIDFNTFLKVDIRIGAVVRAEMFTQARKPAIKLWIDFGPKIGQKKSSAQITEDYQVDGLVGKQVVAVINLPPRQIASFISEVLVLGAWSSTGGITLLNSDKEVKLGERVH
jgi:tRNA-binding protein